MRVLQLFRRSKKGQVYQGKVLNSSDPLLVKWPGPHGCQEDGSIDPKVPLEWDRKEKLYRRVR